MLQFWTVGCGYVYYNIMVHGIAVLIAGGHIQYMCYLKLLTLISWKVFVVERSFLDQLFNFSNFA
jgi:hypothetical protein